MKYGFLFLIFSMTTAVSAPPAFISQENHKIAFKSDQDVMVYICDSKGAKKYHLVKNCRGLSNCKHDIIKVSLKTAVSKGKEDLCGWED